MRRFLTVMAMLAFGAGCAAMTVSSHIERTANFADYVTYDWGPPDSLPVGDPRLDNNPFFQDYVQGAIEKRLAAKGYERALTGPPDVLIHYHASVDARHGYSYGNFEPQVSQYEQGTLVIDVVDNRTGKVVWRGWAQDVMEGVIDNQSRLKKRVDEGVSRMMAQFPAGGAAFR